ncbi:MAG: hypothetical protein ISS74_01260 [Planctomycetes bacterium]|nr:hypothetical protein [Planctomycetota bacterium]
MDLRRTWAIAIAVLGAGLAVLGLGLAFGRPADSFAWATAPSSAEAANVAISATPVGDEKVVVCLVDTVRERLMVYLADGKRTRLKLLAVRDISADWALSDYNNERPYPKDIRQRIEAFSGAVEPPEETSAPKPPG